MPIPLPLVSETLSLVFENTNVSQTLEFIECLVVRSRTLYTFPT